MNIKCDDCSKIGYCPIHPLVFIPVRPACLEEELEKRDKEKRKDYLLISKDSRRGYCREHFKKFSKGKWPLVFREYCMECSRIYARTHYHNNIEKCRKFNNKRMKISSNQLKDCYIKGLLRQNGFSNAKITKEMIINKRLLIQERRKRLAANRRVRR